jgi:lipopolysaccharide/colanic/teichoic acid biosynthesis glycosyltransferase
LIVFNAKDIIQNYVAVSFLIKLLRKRIRLSDDIGWFDRDKIGVILPDTPGDGAWIIVKDIVNPSESQFSTLSCMVFTYPSNWTPNLKDNKLKNDSTDQAPNQEFLKLRKNLSTDNIASKKNIDYLPKENFSKHSSHSVMNLMTLFIRRIPIWKRTLDIFGSLIALVMFSFPMMVIAIAIKVTSPGKVIFRQRRMGQGGVPFEIYKFRSMFSNTNDDLHKDYLCDVINKSNEENSEGIYKLTNDPRVTPVGKFIRRWSLDELPQLFNVLKGDMSLVGPRPEPIYAYNDYDSWYHSRCIDAKPGLTGLWQVEGRCRVTYEDMIRMDLRYCQNICLVKDLNLILRTFKAVFSRSGAY